MSADPSLREIAKFLLRLQWAALAIAVVWLIWLLAPVLTPFVCAVLLGWLGDPLVRWLMAKGRSRNTAVVLVFVLMTLLIVLVVLIVVPLVEDQIVTLLRSLPKYRDWLLGTGLTWIEQRSGMQLHQWLDMKKISDFLHAHLQGAGDLVRTLLSYVTRSGFAVFGWLANVLLIPIVTFYVLRDWPNLVAGVREMIPRDQVDTVERLARESSDVLGAFLRGQFLVMVALGAMYGLGLWAVGLDLGILIGIMAGLFTFIPYMGPATGLSLGTLAAVMQYGDAPHVLGVLVVFGIGQVIESYFLTPKLVGDRIGLHPVAVIFAVLVGGQLFGFLGMLLALPIAAISNVLLRYVRERYKQSHLYVGEKPKVHVDTFFDRALASRDDDKKEP